MGKVKVRGFNKVEKELKRMQKNAQELSGTHSVSFDELFTPAFMRKYTSFSSLDALMEAGGFHAETDEEFEAIPDGPFDAHIANVTVFDTWADMLDAATQEYVTRKLGF